MKRMIITSEHDTKLSIALESGESYEGQRFCGIIIPTSNSVAIDEKNRGGASLVA